MIFPCIVLFFVIFQVFHDFQSVWEPCPERAVWAGFIVFVSMIKMHFNIQQTTISGQKFIGRIRI